MDIRAKRLVSQAQHWYVIKQAEKWWHSRLATMKSISLPVHLLQYAASGMQVTVIV